MKRALVLVAIAACGKSGASTRSGPPVELPKVLAGKVDPPAPNVTVTTTAIVVDGSEVLALANGELATADIEGKTAPKLAALSARLSAPLVVAFDKHTSWKTMAITLESLARPDEPILALANVAGMTAGEPIELVRGELSNPMPTDDLRAQIEAAGSGVTPPSRPLLPMVTLAHGKAMLWSRSGLDGAPTFVPSSDTAQISIDLAMRMRNANATDGELVLVIGAATTAQEVIGTVGDVFGQFPHIRLSSLVE